MGGGFYAVSVVSAISKLALSQAPQRQPPRISAERQCPTIGDRSHEIEEDWGLDSESIISTLEEQKEERTKHDISGKQDLLRLFFKAVFPLYSRKAATKDGSSTVQVKARQACSK